MEIKQIRYFMWVYEEGSFSKAAQKARVAQPVLSMQIRRLEDEFGVQLFERHARGIRPTESGLALYRRAVSIVNNVTAAEKELRLQNSGESLVGRLHVGLPGIFNRSLLKDVLLPFTEAYPGVEVTVSEAYTGTLVDWVRDGVIDFALGAKPLSEGNLVQKHVYSENHVDERRSDFRTVVLSLRSPIIRATQADTSHREIRIWWIGARLHTARHYQGREGS